MARIDLPILLRNDGSYDAMNERAKVSFFSIRELPEVNNQTQISLSDLFSQMDPPPPNNSNKKENSSNTRIRIDEPATTTTSMDLSWFRPMENANAEEDNSHSDIPYNNTTLHNTISSDTHSENEQHMSAGHGDTHPTFQPSEDTDILSDGEEISSVSKSETGSENEPENEIPVMQIMRSEIKQRKMPTQGKTFKKYDKRVRNFTQKKYSAYT